MPEPEPGKGAVDNSVHGGGQPGTPGPMPDAGAPGAPAGGQGTPGSGQEPHAGPPASGQPQPGGTTLDPYAEVGKSILDQFGGDANKLGYSYNEVRGFAQQKAEEAAQLKKQLEALTGGGGYPPAAGPYDPNNPAFGGPGAPGMEDPYLAHINASLKQTLAPIMEAVGQTQAYMKTQREREEADQVAGQDNAVFDTFYKDNPEVSKVVDQDLRQFVGTRIYDALSDPKYGLPPAVRANTMILLAMGKNVSRLSKINLEAAMLSRQSRADGAPLGGGIPPAAGGDADVAELLKKYKEGGSKDERIMQQILAAKRRSASGGGGGQ